MMKQRMRRPWLAPLIPLYAAGLALHGFSLALRNWLVAGTKDPIQRLDWPVVSIGNLSTGGSGKTPLTIALAELLSEAGWHVDVLSRGYGRTNKQALHVDVSGRAEDFGDEPLMIARTTGLDVYVARHRVDAGRLAEQSYDRAGMSRDRISGDGIDSPGVHLLDDGFQHRQLHRDVDVLILQRRDLDDYLLPGGDLREPLHGLTRATVVAVPADEPEVEEYLRAVVPCDHAASVKGDIGDFDSGDSEIGHSGCGHRDTGHSRWSGPIWRIRRTMQIPGILSPAASPLSNSVASPILSPVPVAAFCGIARPDQFFAGLALAGLRPVVRLAFADHHRYTSRDLEGLLSAARAAGATALLTTEKDIVRLGADAARLNAALPLQAVVLRTEIEESGAVVAWLVNRLTGYSADERTGADRGSGTCSI